MRDDKRFKQLNLILPTEERDTVKQLAEMDNLSISDYIRNLIKKDAKKKSVSVKLEVPQHGGKRRTA